MGEKFELANVSHRAPVGNTDLMTLINYLHDQFDFSVSWEDAEEMIKLWGGPFAIKGISSVSDAKRAVEVGATTLILSNHGGRQLDSAVTPIGLLPEVRRAVGESVELILDGGIRRGTDIFKALALGANACSVGRPYLYGLATNGEKGVSQALNILKAEFERTMGLMGITSIRDINRGSLEGGKLLNENQALIDLFQQFKKFAIIGVSQTWQRPSNFVGKYLLNHGYTVYPVNPNYQMVLGSLLSIVVCDSLSC